MTHSELIEFTRQDVPHGTWPDLARQQDLSLSARRSLCVSRKASAAFASLQHPLVNAPEGLVEDGTVRDLFRFSPNGGSDRRYLRVYFGERFRVRESSCGRQLNYDSMHAPTKPSVQFFANPARWRSPLPSSIMVHQLTS
jgi:hypothetical protein